MKPFIKVERDHPTIYFYLFILKKPLLVLNHSIDRSSKNRQLFYIVGGLLTKNLHGGRLEFRKILDDRTFVSAIHNFHPSLPWYIYIFTQAPIHWFTMKAFSRHLALLKSKGDYSQ